MAALKYIPKLHLTFKLKDGSTKEGIFKQYMSLGEVLASLGIAAGKAKLGRKTLDQHSNLGQLGLQNNEVIEVK